MIYGIDNLDADSINLAAQEIYFGSDAIARATEALERVKNSRGL
jgi:hypothetical protein